MNAVLEHSVSQGRITRKGVQGHFRAVNHYHNSYTHFFMQNPASQSFLLLFFFFNSDQQSPKPGQLTKSTAVSQLFCKSAFNFWLGWLRFKNSAHSYCPCVSFMPHIQCNKDTKLFDPSTHMQLVAELLDLLNFPHWILL